MQISGNLAVNWELFREGFEDYVIAKKTDEEYDKIQVSVLKFVMGVECKTPLSSCCQKNSVPLQKWCLTYLRSTLSPLVIHGMNAMNLAEPSSSQGKVLTPS